MPTTGLHVIHINAKSLILKTSELKLIANKNKPRITIVSEMWLDGLMTGGLKNSILIKEE